MPLLSRRHTIPVHSTIDSTAQLKCSAIEVCGHCYLTVEALHKPVKKRKKMESIVPWNRLCCVLESHAILLGVIIL